MKFDGRYVNLGCFNSTEDAHAAYEIKASELYGDFKRKTDNG